MSRGLGRSAGAFRSEAQHGSAKELINNHVTKKRMIIFAAISMATMHFSAIHPWHPGDSSVIA
jgi:hypothetical protein